MCVYTTHNTKAPPTSSGRGVRVVGADSKPVPTRFILPAYPKQKLYKNYYKYVGWCKSCKRFPLTPSSELLIQRLLRQHAQKLGTDRFITFTKKFHSLKLYNLGVKEISTSGYPKKKLVLIKVVLNFICLDCGGGGVGAKL